MHPGSAVLSLTDDDGVRIIYGIWAVWWAVLIWALWRGPGDDGSKKP